MRSSRRHRLPQRLDYTLIPAPLDLSRLLDDKSALPAIIVTPSSPTGATDFAIAFLAPEPKDSLYSRVTSRFKIGLFLSQLKARTLLLLLLPLLILTCHVVTHRLAVHRPLLHFDVHTQKSYVRADNTSGGEVVDIDTSVDPLGGWFGLRDHLKYKHARNFAVSETGDQ